MGRDMTWKITHMQHIRSWCKLEKTNIIKRTWYQKLYQSSTHQQGMDQIDLKNRNLLVKTYFSIRFLYATIGSTGYCNLMAHLLWSQEYS